MSVQKQEGKPTVAFRTEKGYFEKLAKRSNRAGTSPHLEAQAIVESVLDGGEDESLLMRGEVGALRGEVDTLRGEVETIRAGLVRMFSVLVAEMSKGKTTVETARAEIERVFAKKDRR